jgi:hypothetical protein
MGNSEPTLASPYNSVMKIKLGWIIAGVGLISIAWMVVPRLTFWISAPTPSASEPPRENQASPLATVEAMFQMMYPTPDPNTSVPPVVDRFNEFHLLAGKDMTPEEQAFSQVFWDTRRSGILCVYITENMTESPRVTDQQSNGDFATVEVSVSVSPPHTAEWTTMIYTFDLKKRGPNWYVYELRVPKAPDGIYNHVKSNS